MKKLKKANGKATRKAPAKKGPHKLALKGSGKLLFKDTVISTDPVSKAKSIFSTPVGDALHALVGSCDVVTAAVNNYGKADIVTQEVLDVAGSLAAIESVVKNAREVIEAAIVKHMRAKGVVEAGKIVAFIKQTGGSRNPKWKPEATKIAFALHMFDADISELLREYAKFVGNEQVVSMIGAIVSKQRKIRKEGPRVVSSVFDDEFDAERFSKEVAGLYSPSALKYKLQLGR